MKKNSISLSFLKWNDFVHISEFILPTFIQNYDKKNHFVFDPVQKRDQKRETNWNFTACQMPHFMIVVIYQFIKLNLSWIKMSIFEEYGTFNWRETSPLILSQHHITNIFGSLFQVKTRHWAFIPRTRHIACLNSRTVRSRSPFAGGYYIMKKTRLFKKIKNVTSKNWKKKKKKKKSDKNSDSFYISAQNIDCGYSLEQVYVGSYSIRWKFAMLHFF